MEFDHERLDVYQRALDFMVLAEGVIRALPRGRRHINDQLTRASVSIVLNIAEGAGKASSADKRRYYLSARGSATESAAILDVCLRLGLVAPADCQAGKQLLERIVAMLIKLAMIFEPTQREA
jgi:four helix bundle protein